MTWGDIDFADRTLRIPADRTKGKRGLALPLTDFVFDLLSARAALGKDKFVFPANSASGHISEPRFALDMVRNRIIFFAKAVGGTVAMQDSRSEKSTALDD